ncbi:MAG: ABC transporter ATP-binding protein [Candidatus Rokuibacteriota bacterium]
MTPSPTRDVWRYTRRYRLRYGLGVVCLGLATAASLAIPWTVKHAIDALSAEGAAAPLGRYVGLIVFLALANGVIRLASRFAMIGGAQRIEADVRADLYAALQTFTPRTFARHTTGDIMARATSDVAAVRSLVGFGGLSLVATAFAFVGALGAMLAVDVRLTLWALAPTPLLVLLARRFNLVVNARAQATQEQLSTLSARVQEALSGITVVRAYTMESRTAARFAEENAEFLRRSMALARAQAGFGPLMGLIAGLGTLVVLWVGGLDVADGRLTLGGLVAFNGYLAYLAWPTVALGLTLSIWQRGLSSMERIREILDGAAPAASAGAAPDGPPALRFAGFGFAYDGRAAVLSDVSFDVAPGEMVAVVGPTGAGKTTLGLVLARLWEPPPGTVFVGGRDVRTLDPGALRAAVGWVPQEAFLFSRSIAENVTLDREGVDAVALGAALDAAAVDAEVAGFAEGAGTVVGERGLTLSGGQRQRVALARALAGRPRILVLDDVFANVDVETERAIFDRLRATDPAGPRTILLVTHRLRAAQAADRIVVLEAGRVVETGSHVTLVAAGGLYARLWRIQQLEEEIARA